MNRIPLPNRILTPVKIGLLVLLFSTQVLAQKTMGPYTDDTVLPDNHAGRYITEFIEVINAADPKGSQAFIERSFAAEFRDSHTMDQHLDLFAMLHRQSGTLKYHSIRRYEEAKPAKESVFILKQTLTDAWMGLIMTVQPEAPFLISGMNIAPARTPSDQAPQPAISYDKLTAKLKHYLDRLVKVDRFSGTVLLAKDGQVIFKQAYGLASRRFDVPNKIDTKFNLGSMNKMFTAVAVAQLVEQGKLSFDDPISKYLSTDWLPIEALEKITVADLLGHTSGLGSYFSEEFMNASRARFRKVDDYKPLVSQSTLQFEPGADWAYSNTGMLLAGAVIEKVVAGSYFDYVRENICKPAGMINTDCYEMDRPVPNLAIGYSEITNPDGSVGWENNIFKHVVKGGPAGGGFSTVEDLLRFDRALRSNKLISKASRDRLWTATPQSEGSYGFGFGIKDVDGGRVVGHNGGFPGINANLDMYLDTGITVAVLANCDSGAMMVSQKLRRLLGRVSQED